ncbi:serine/threonine-protein kinase-like protein At3g51990 [Salvia hispanica]|uniref:serine/threonine-protein kinase-like protein At3g51990 n=1 Tax=Salvia hispanica TaxID=49212 RepID=UPI002009AB04|nr:serine/threonine-protein kinase-like protein At3g51990 [Salvia hispanica]
MGYFSCNNKSAIAICDSYNFELLSKNPKRNRRRPFKLAEFDFSDLHSATDGFSPAKLLGKGSHGSVYKAELRELGLTAAVKKTKVVGGTGNRSSPADNEVEILSRIYHPRLVNLIGFGSDPDQHKLIVVEYMPNGSLFDQLHGPGRPPGWVKRTRFALQVARAVQFLHSSQPPIIHRDIKSSNVLIDSDFNSRVSDFGLALRGHVEDARVRSAPPAGTLGYLDPCYLAPGDLSAKSDVFSFGILLLEMISGRHAIDVGHSPPSVVEWAAPEIGSGNLDAICDPRIGAPHDAEALRRMAALAARCVGGAAEERPAMAEAVECLESVHRRMKAGSRRTSCASVRRRATKYEALDGGGGSNGAVSSEARSKSIGAEREIEFEEGLDFGSGKRAGFGVKMSMVRLSKSKSMGVVRSRRLINGGRIVGSNVIAVGSVKWEDSKLLGVVDFDEEKTHTLLTN